MYKKELFACALAATGALSVCRQWLTPGNNALPILAYHRIKSPVKNYPYDSELISATPEDFLWQMQHIKQHYTPIRLNDVGRYFAKQLAWPARPVIVTFDDGFDDNYHHAFPVLKQLQIPATFFLATDYIGTSNSYWFDQVVLLLKQLTRLLDLKSTNHQIRLDPKMALKQQQRALFNLLKEIPDDERQDLVAQLSAAVEVKIDADMLQHSQPMNWEQVREMSATGLMDFGSHTASHPALNQLAHEVLLRELQQSKLKIEQQTGKTCDIMAYPFGGNEITTPQVLDAVQQTGYRFACMYQQNYSTRTPENLLKLERIHVETDISRARFAAMLAMPGIFS